MPDTTIDPTKYLTAGQNPYTVQNFPGYDAIMSDIKGVISPDVKTQLTQTAAERGISMGMPGAPATDATLMRSIGLTSDALRARGISELAPLYQQQVSEAGQSARQVASLGTSIELSKLQEAGLDARQAAALQAEMQRLQYSTNVQQQMQARELQAAMDRLKTGNASQMDLEKLRQAGQQSLQTQALGSEAALQAQRLALQKYITDEQTKLGYYNANLYGQRYAPQTGTQSVPDKVGGTKQVTGTIGPGGVFVPSDSPRAYGAGLPGFEGVQTGGGGEPDLSNIMNWTDAEWNNFLGAMDEYGWNTGGGGGGAGGGGGGGNQELVWDDASGEWVSLGG